MTDQFRLLDLLFSNMAQFHRRFLLKCLIFKVHEKVSIDSPHVLFKTQSCDSYNIIRLYLQAQEYILEAFFMFNS